MRNALSLRLAMTELEACHELLVRSDANQDTMTPVEKRELRASVRSKCELAVRLVEEVCGVVDD